MFLDTEGLLKVLHILIENVLELSFNIAILKNVHYVLPLNSLGEKKNQSLTYYQWKQNEDSAVISKILHNYFELYE